MALISRVNLGNVKILGLVDDLELSGSQYTNCLAIYTVFYIVAEIPSNLLLKRLTPRICLAGLTFLWGIAAMCMVRGLLLCGAPPSPIICSTPC